MKNLSPTDVMKEMKSKMKKSLDHVLHELSTLHTGKATPAMVDSIMVDAYGSNSRLKDISAITTSDARTIVIQPWDKGLIKAIEKAIIVANIGLNPVTDSGIIRCPVPELNKERRQQLVKMAHEMGEEGKISIRGSRRDALEIFKKMQKEGVISEDDFKRFDKEVQSETKKHEDDIVKALAHKEKDLMHV